MTLRGWAVGWGWVGLCDFVEGDSVAEVVELFDEVVSVAVDVAVVEPVVAEVVVVAVVGEEVPADDEDWNAVTFPDRRVTRPRGFGVAGMLPTGSDNPALNAT